MTIWFVSTPPYPYHEAVLDDGSGPTYDVADCMDVRASTRHEAIVAAVRYWSSLDGDTYCKMQRCDGLNPFSGIVAKSEDEVKAEARASGPPDHAPDLCDACGDIHPCRWYWKDDDVEWGWYSTCLAETEVTA